jgi:hypothetical protein
MKPMERVQLVAVIVLFTVWIIMIVDAWPLLAAHLTPLEWLPIIAVHGLALLSAVGSYFKSRQPPSLRSAEVLQLRQLVQWQ